MKKYLLFFATFLYLSVNSQNIVVPNNGQAATTAQPKKWKPAKKKVASAPGKITYVGKVRNAKKPGQGNTSSPAIYPNSKPGQKNVVVQYVYADSAFPDRENAFPAKGKIGIGTLAPQYPLEIKGGGGNTRQKNVMMALSNEWAENGQNEPSIMFSNGDINPSNVSYWTVGARVSGGTLNTPQTFKVCFKPNNSTEDQEYFSIDSYQGRVKIGNVNTQVDGYKLYVEEGILTEKVKVAVKNSEDWFDHVLKQDYKLIPIYQLENFIKDNGHLPDMPTTQEVMTNGLDLGKMNGLLLKKVEELTLYMIEIKKELDETKKELEATKAKMN